MPIHVAPRVGAWIEKCAKTYPRKYLAVAPRVGAWIEKNVCHALEESFKSHPVWVRGLKRLNALINSSTLVSHPVWVRGLKTLSQNVLELETLSHPVWVRGLKTDTDIGDTVRVVVAPRVGAWIEKISKSS